MSAENAMDRKYNELDKLTTQLNQCVDEAAREGKAIHDVERDIWRRV